MAAWRMASGCLVWLMAVAIGAGVLSADGFAAPAERAARESVKVFVLAGQSNMAGRASAVDLPAPYRSAPRRIQIDYVCSFGASDLLKPEDYSKEAGPPEPHRSNGWTALLPAPKHLSTPAAHFGPEIGLGHELAARWPEQRIAFVKCGRGATSLAEDWAPDAPAGRRLYPDMLAQVRRALARLAADGAVVELAAFVWCQGEADTTRREWAEAYEKNLQAFFSRVRRDLAAPRLPIVFSLTGDGRKNPKMLFPHLVRQAQRNVAAREPNARLVAGDDLPLLDHVHYDAAGQLALGKRLAEAYLRRQDARP